MLELLRDIISAEIGITTAYYKSQEYNNKSLLYHITAFGDQLFPSLISNIRNSNLIFKYIHSTQIKEPIQN